MIPTSRLSLNQATVKPLTLTQTLDLCLRYEIPAVGLWRDRVAELGLNESAAAVRRSGLHVSSLCRGGFFTHPDADGRAAYGVRAPPQDPAHFPGLPEGTSVARTVETQSPGCNRSEREASSAGETVAVLK